VAKVLLLSQLLAKVQGTRSWDCGQKEVTAKIIKATTKK
jgi:hypothetical protein